MALHGASGSHPHQKYSYRHGNHQVNLGVDNGICDTGGFYWSNLNFPSWMSTFILIRSVIIRYIRSQVSRNRPFHALQHLGERRVRSSN